MAGQCKFVRANGQGCQAGPRRGRPFCFHHDPESVAERDAARQKGGRNRSKPAAVLPAGETDAPLGTTADVVALLGRTINQTRRGEVDAKVANAVGYLSATLLRALEPGEVMRQIEALRREVAELKGNPHGDGDGTATRRELTQLRKDVARLKARTAGHPLLHRLRADPARVLADARLTPDPWQETLLREAPPRTLLLCSRQAGKSQAAAALALHAALTRPEALVLLLSPTLRQSGELFRDKTKRLYNQLGRPVATVQESQLTMELANGSRVISLPGDEGTIRGYSGVNLLVIDEAARVPDDLYRAVRPMLAVSGGGLIAMSSAWAKLGWFYEEWSGAHDWHRVKVTADQCPRIDPEFLREEAEALGPRWFAMEYMCEFTDAVDALFTEEDVRAALDNDLKPLFAN